MIITTVARPTKYDILIDRIQDVSINIRICEDKMRMIASASCWSASQKQEMLEQLEREYDVYTNEHERLLERLHNLS